MGLKQNFLKFKYSLLIKYNIVYKTNLEELKEKSDQNELNDAYKFIKKIDKLKISEDTKRKIIFQSIYISHDKKIYLKIPKEIDSSIFEDKNFEEIFSMISTKIFDSKISEIIKNGNSSKLVELIKNNINIDKIDQSIFSDDIFETLLTNQTLKKYNILETMDEKTIEIIKKGYLNGFVYVLENIPNSLNIIKSIDFPIESLSSEFIDSLELENLRKIYSSNFSGRNFIKECIQNKNYELINDCFIINDGLRDGYIKDITQETKLIETLSEDKKRLFLLKKYFNGLDFILFDTSNFKELKFLVENIPNNIENKEIKEILSKILKTPEDKLNELDLPIKEINKEKNESSLLRIFNESKDKTKEEYTQTITAENQKIKDNCKKRPLTNESGEIIKSKDGNNIEIYDLEGEPFVMITHVIGRNSIKNGEISNKLGSNPEKWVSYEGSNRTMSTAVISNEKMNLFTMKNNAMPYGSIVIGFSNLEPNSLIQSKSSDAGSEMGETFSETEKGRTSKNVFISVDEQLKGTKEDEHNETQISRYDSNGKKIKPSYVVCLDQVDDYSIKWAKEYDVPIYLIHTEKYNKKRNTEKALLENIKNELEMQKQEQIEETKIDTI